MIGVFPEEEEAFTLVSLLMWLLPTIVILGALLDVTLFYLFSTKFHPWAGILSEIGIQMEERTNAKEKVVMVNQGYESGEPGKVLQRKSCRHRTRQ